MIIDFSTEQLNKIHSLQLEMLLEVDRICRLKDIKYVISGGTLLGAVRSNGFIPWDEDIDIRMERNEYERFCLVCKTELNKEKFFWQTRETDSDYPWFYGKMRYNNTKYVRAGQEHIHMHSGIFIDVMPADGVPNDKKGQIRISKKVFCLKKMLYAVVGSKYEKKTLRRLFYKVINLFPKKDVFNRLNKIASKYKSNEYEFVTCYSFTSPNQTEYTLRDWHLDRVEMNFEGYKVYAPKEYDKWLKMTYGEDYLTPPPEKERVMHLEFTEFSLGD